MPLLFGQRLPNASIRVLVGMMSLKEGQGWSDEQLFEQCRYNLLVRSALGVMNLTDTGIASINNYPVYIENRNGNSNVKYKQAETLKRAYGVLAGFGIKVKHSRMDCGSFDKTVIPVVEADSTYFYIWAQRCENLYDQIGEITRRETVTIGMKDYEAASIEYAPFGGEKTYRYVIARKKNSDGQGNLFTGDDFTYRAIMTNNGEMSDKDVVEFYNDRGESERLFDEMNNDFLWKKMPFSFLHENTVFLVMMAICRNLYHFLIEFISRKLDFIKPCKR